MTTSLERARAFVDGELTESEAIAFEHECSDNPDLVADVEALDASRLPYREAMNTQAQPAMPTELRTKIAAELSAARTEFAHGDSVVPFAKSPEQTSGRFSGLKPLAIAASFLVGMITGPLALGLFDKDAKPMDEDAIRAALVADYQSLYVPETIVNIDRQQSRQAAEELLASIAARSGLPSNIPNFESEGYEFVRAQELGYLGEPLVQLVYAKPGGNPIALCFNPVDSKQPDDARVVVEQLADFGTIRWRDGDTRFLIVANEGTEGLTALRELSLKPAG